MKHQIYYSALDRLKNNKPEILPKWSYKINKDTVAIEAGRGRGAIKASRSEFTDLIKKIKDVATDYENQKVAPLNKAKAKANRYKVLSEKYKSDYLLSLNREAMLLSRVKNLEVQINQLIAEKNVIHLKK